MADLAKYVVSLEAETARYTQQLQQANNKLERFQERNTAALKRLDNGFSNMSNRFTLVAGKLRAVAGLFGVAFGARAFAGWIRDAIEIEKLTDSQAKAIRGAGSAMQELTGSVGDLAREFSTRLAPSIEHAAKWWRAFLFPTDQESAASRVDRLNDLIQDLAPKLDRLSQGNPSDARWKEIERLTLVMKGYREELERLSPVAQTIAAPPGPNQSLETFIAQMQFEEKLREEQAKAAKEHADMIAKGQQLSPELGSFIERLEQGEKLSASMRTEVEEQVDAWREAKQLFDEGIVSSDTLARLDEAQFETIEVTAKRLKGIKDEANKFAVSLGQDMRHAFSSWLVGGELDFKDFLKRLAAEWASSQIFSALGTAFAGAGGGGFTNFLADMFGGFRAGGGPVSPGKGYIVGERGPEWFMPNSAGAIVPGGQAVNVTQHFHYDVALESVDDRIRQSAGPISSATVSAIMKALNRPSMA